MNHIQRLTEENAALKAQLNEASEMVTQFMTSLLGPKFTGEENGERKDWISTGDVSIFLSGLRPKLTV